jgi:toxin ParE1/3/4
MGKYKVAFSRYANRDLEKIVRFIARDNPAAANELGQKLITRALTLTEPGMAMMGSALQQRPEIHRLIEGNYLIYYRVFLARKRVRILRFWHAARDPDRLKLNV